MDKYFIQEDNITSEDIRDVVELHKQEINQGFLSSLGDKALDLLFLHAAESKTGVLLIAKDKAEGETCGFLLGSLNTGKFYKDFLLKKSFSAFICLIPKLLSPAKIRKILETLFYPTKKNMQNLPDAELLDIAISKERQGTGLAQHLFAEFSNILSKLSIEEFKITTGESLVRAQRFYETLGAKRVKTIEVHRGQKTIVYIYRIVDKAVNINYKSRG